jgi:hypothetical protein
MQFQEKKFIHFVFSFDGKLSQAQRVGPMPAQGRAQRRPGLEKYPIA